MKLAPGTQKGFTLLELSIVVAIIALVTGMAVTSGIGAIASARITATQQKMKTIENALLQYRVVNDRLPCPTDLTVKPGSANYGIEAAIPGTCTGGTPAANFTAASLTGGAFNTTATAAEGALPAITLGLLSDLMYDGWGNRFRYAVDISMTALSAFSNTPVGCTVGAVTVKDMNGAARSTSSIYALISHGPNGHGAYTANGIAATSGSTSADELTNCHCNSAGNYTSYTPAYVQKSPAYDTGHTGSALYYFDDLVTYKERWQMQTSWDMAGSCSTAKIFVADQSNNRIQVFNGGGVSAGYIGSAGSGNGQFSDAVSVALDATGNIWGLDEYNNRVEQFDGSGRYISQFGSSGPGNGQLADPWAIAVDASGNVWVVDNGANRVEKFSSSGTFLLGIGSGYQLAGGSVGSAGSGNGQFNSPQGVAIDKNGNVWVTDTNNSRLQKFSSNGAYLLQTGSFGSGNGQLNGVSSIAVDASSNIWVTDWSNARVEEFSSSGVYLSQFGTWGTGNGQFHGPSGLAIDASNNIWIADYNLNRLQEFNSNGSYIRQTGSFGSGNGQLSSPFGVAIGLH